MLELIAALAVAASVPGAATPVAPAVPAPSRSVVHARRTTPPSLTPGALATELRESNRRRFEELAEIQRERARLEQLGAQIAIARRDLARESALLDEKLAKLEARAAEQERTAEERPSSVERPSGDGPGSPGDAQVLALAKTLKGMKPDQAAALVARIEKSLAVAVLTRLRPADAAGVLGRMPSGNAAELFTLMARNGASPR